MSQDIHNMFAIVIPVESGTPFMFLLRNVCMEFSFSFFLLGDILFNHGNKKEQDLLHLQKCVDLVDFEIDVILIMM